MESFIVRIYRRGVGDAIDGVLEEPLSRRSRAFHSLVELAELLRRAPRRQRRSPPAGTPDSADDAR